MTRNMRHLGLPFRRGACRSVVVVLIAWMPVWLSPSALFASVVTDSAAVHHAKPARRGTGTPESWRLPAALAQFFGRHTALEPEESVESAAQNEARIAGTFPLLRSQHDPVISRISAMIVQARLSVLQSRALPLIC
jgi:hypothetical protein